MQSTYFDHVTEIASLLSKLTGFLCCFMLFGHSPTLEPCYQKGSIKLERERGGMNGEKHDKELVNCEPYTVYIVTGQ